MLKSDKSSRLPLLLKGCADLERVVQKRRFKKFVKKKKCSIIRDELSHPIPSTDFCKRERTKTVKVSNKNNV